MKNNSEDIVVAVASRDPFFLFAARALLGRDRVARIYAICRSLEELESALESAFGRIDAIVVDVDSFANQESFVPRLEEMVGANGDTKWLCLAERNLPRDVPLLENVFIHGLLAKHDLRFCLHLAVRALVREGVVLLSTAVGEHLTRGSYLHRMGRTLGAEQEHPDLTTRIEEVVIWRIFIGLDNPDIQDELMLGKDTIREYVSKAYKSLGAGNELEAFEALSDWWWVSRFTKALR